MLAPSYVSTGNLSGSLEAASTGLFKCFAENSFKANVGKCHLAASGTLKGNIRIRHFSIRRVNKKKI